MPEPGFPVERLYCPALRQHQHGEAAARILAAALAAVEPGAAVHRYLTRQGSLLRAGEKTYDLDQVHRVTLVGFGKAALPMGCAAAEVLGDRLQAGILVTKQGQAGVYPEPIDRRLRVLEAAHPVPDQSSLEASRQVIDLLGKLEAEDLLVCLISGGGSALLTAPAEGILLDDLQQLTSLLLGCGASIFEINTLRKHLEQLKGGGLARLAAPAQLAALVLSDVIGDPLDVIASGPAVPDPTTFADTLKILESHRIFDQVPDSIRQRLLLGAQGSLPETPKPGDACFERVGNVIVASNRQAAHAAAAQAEQEGFKSIVLTTSLQGEARQAGRFLAALARELAAGEAFIQKPACLILGGETTVNLQGSGLGGRNQELALGAVADLAGLGSVLLIALATDGGDGPTDAAGAVVSGDTLSLARQLGLEAAAALQNNDSYHFFQPLGALLKPGPTQTNVNDLAFVFAFKP